MAVPAIAAPTSELGTTQQNNPWSTPVLDETEVNRDLTWPRSVKTYASMLNDAQVEGLYRGLMYPIHGYDWWLDPNGAAQSAVDRVGADYNLPVGADQTINLRRAARRFIFDEHLEDALRGPGYGHYFFEQVYELLQDGPAGVNGGWVAHLRKLAPRPPATVREIRPARDGGLDWIRVPALNPPDAGLALHGGVKLPVDRLVAYIWDREGSNWKGRSMFRSLYRPWKLKDRVIRVGVINIERAGGVPYIEAPDGAGKTAMADLHQLASQFRVGESAGAALPHGATLKFAQAAGGDQAVAYVQLQNEEMARAWVQMINVLGQTQTGSRALGDTFSARAATVEKKVAGWFCNVFNRHVIEDDVELNEGPAAEYSPLLRYKPAGNPVDALAGALDNAQTAGALPAASQVAAAVRQAAGERQPVSRAEAMRHQITASTDAAIPLPARELRRQPYAHEVRAAVDFAALETDWTSTEDATVTAVQDAQAAQIDELHGQIVNADGDLGKLAAIAASSVPAALIADPAKGLARLGRDSALAEAAAQGHTIGDVPLDPVDATLEARAAATTTVLAKALSETAARKALEVAGAGAFTPTETADTVRNHLLGLTPGFLRDVLSGVMTQAQNSGRKATMRAGNPERIYASELLDANTCEFCTSEDGTEFPSLDEAERDYPSGGFVGCKGGPRCRGTLVAVYAESAPTVP